MVFHKMKKYTPKFWLVLSSLLSQVQLVLIDTHIQMSNFSIQNVLHTSTCSTSLTAPDRCYYLNQAYLTMFIVGLKRGKTNRSQTATDMVMVIT